MSKEPKDESQRERKRRRKKENEREEMEGSVIEKWKVGMGDVSVVKEI